MAAQILTTALHFCLCLFLVVYRDMGIRGLGIATSLSYFACWLMTTIYSHLCIPKIRKAFFFPGGESFRNWWKYLKISLPNAVMVCASWWAYEILTFLAGTIGVNELATQTIVASIAGLLIQIPLGLSEGVCAVTGNCIGVDNVELGKRFVRLVAKVTLVIVFAISLSLFFLSTHVAQLFTTDVSVLELSYGVLRLVSVVYLIDAT